MKSKETEEVIIEESSEKADDPLVPQMNINVPAEQPKEELITDKELITAYDEVVTNLKEDRKQAEDFITKLADMVFNEGDASNSSKEALVNMFKTKSDIADKLIKIADLKTRIKLKERDTFPKFLAVHQNNTINNSPNTRNRALIEEITRRNKDNEEL